MKLRYYLRGLGIGIIVTAIIMNVAFSHKQEMSDEEIKARAAELGMIENTVLAPNHTPTPTAGLAAQGQEQPGTAAPSGTDQQETTVTPTPTTEPTETPTPTPTTVSTETPMPTETPTPTPTTAPTETPTPTPTTAPTETPTPTPTTVPTETPTPTPTMASTQETVTITINGGESSVTVSRKVAEAGLVESASDFDQYLCINGYDKKLAVGNHEIPVGSTYEEIARKLTRSGN